MKLIEINSYLNLREELNEFVTLCNRYNYTPSKDEFDDVIRFILLQQGGGASHLCESYELNPFKLMNHLYESFDFDEIHYIDEAAKDSTYDAGADYDSAVGTATTGVKMAGAAALGGAVAVGVFISYLFKKGKIKGMVQKELDAEMKKLQGYQELATKRKELAVLKGETVKMEWPGMASGGSSKEKE